MSITNSEGKSHYITLDAMRGIAALSVVIMHWFNGLGFKGYLESSELAVDFFFMLSGFVVAYSYDERLIKGFSFSKFLLLRIIRLYPMIILGAFLGFLKLEVKSLIGTGALDIHYLYQLALTILLLPENLLYVLFETEININDQFFPINFAFWSLFFEFTMYIIYGFLLFRLNKLQLLWVSVFALIGVTFWFRSNFGLIKIDSIDPIKTTLFFGFSRALFFFTMGLIVFRSKNKLSKIGTMLPISVLGTLPLLFAIPKSWLPWLLTESLAIIIFISCILIGISNKNSNSKIERLLGEISYPVYVLHIPLIWGVTFFIKKALNLSLPDQIIWLGFVAIPITIIASYFALKVYDEPTRKWLKNRFSI